MSTTALPSLAYPGLFLGSSSKYHAGPGTHTFKTGIYASISGCPSILPADSRPLDVSYKKNTSSATGKSQKPSLTVPRILPSPAHAAIPSAQVTRTTPLLPKVGHIVLARVVRVKVKQVDVVILCVQNAGVTAQWNENTSVGQGLSKGSVVQTAAGDGGEWVVCKDGWPGVVRKEDVKATEKDKVNLSEGFRVGDIVRGGVISIGDQANYYLTTATNDFGVLMAESEAGNTMYPISWREFKDPVTGETEARKVAKPF